MADGNTLWDMLEDMANGKAAEPLPPSPLDEIKRRLTRLEKIVEICNANFNEVLREYREEIEKLVIDVHNLDETDQIATRDAFVRLRARPELISNLVRCGVKIMGATIVALLLVIILMLAGMGLGQIILWGIGIAFGLWVLIGILNGDC